METFYGDIGYPLGTNGIGMTGRQRERISAMRFSPFFLNILEHCSLLPLLENRIKHCNKYSNHENRKNQ